MLEFGWIGTCEEGGQRRLPVLLSSARVVWLVVTEYDMNERHTCIIVCTYLLKASVKLLPASVKNS